MEERAFRSEVHMRSIGCGRGKGRNSPVGTATSRKEQTTVGVLGSSVRSSITRVRSNHDPSLCLLLSTITRRLSVHVRTEGGMDDSHSVTIVLVSSRLSLPR